MFEFDVAAVERVREVVPLAKTHQLQSMLRSGAFTSVNSLINSITSWST